MTIACMLTFMSFMPSKYQIKYILTSRICTTFRCISAILKCSSDFPYFSLMGFPSCLKIGNQPCRTVVVRVPFMEMRGLTSVSVRSGKGSSSVPRENITWPIVSCMSLSQFITCVSVKKCEFSTEGLLLHAQRKM